MKRPHIQFSLRTFLTVTTALAIYIAAYFALLSPTILATRSNGGFIDGYYIAHYRVADPVCKVMFAPANFVDCFCRPPFWRIDPIDDQKL